MSSGEKRGYWIVHLISIKDQEVFFKHLAKANEGTKYGGLTRVFAPVKKTLRGEPVEFCAVIEFPSVKAAIGCWDDMEDYAAARAILGEDETKVVERRVCVIEADPLPDLKPGQGFWINHVEEIVDQTAFFAYANASMHCFTSTHFGPVVKQLIGSPTMVLAAVLGFDSPQAAIECYEGGSADYKSAKEAGGMSIGGDENHVVKRTICVVEYNPEYDQKAKQ